MNGPSTALPHTPQGPAPGPPATTSTNSTSTLHYSRDESSTAQNHPVISIIGGGVGENSFARTHSRAPSQRSAGVQGAGPGGSSTRLNSSVNLHGNGNGVHGGGGHGSVSDDEDDTSSESARHTTTSNHPGTSNGQTNLSASAGELGYDGSGTGTGTGMGEVELGELNPAMAWEGSLHWVNKRHRTSGNPAFPGEEERDMPPWRLRSRMKTFSAALTLCLNLGIDPPDVVKTTPCAKMECWVDPDVLSNNSRAIESIARNLQTQFDTLSPKVRYKQHIDPSAEETKKFCINLRRQAKDERVLLYYNGHGVPKPTASGEIWVFNKNLTQYIPVSLHDLQTWLGSACIFVWECSAAGNIVTNYNRWAAERDASASKHAESRNGGNPEDPNSNPDSIYSPYLDCIHLAACQADQTLPMTPELPADLFTCCLTSPIEIALRFFVLQDPLRGQVDSSDPKSKITVDSVMKIPGDLKDRRTPLGELHWIFTAVTDTIAWLMFPTHIFKRLYRQDLLVAALFRNYLLAERIMRAYNCTPISHPVLPATHNHPLWHSWDLAVDACLNQLPSLLEADQRAKDGAPPLPPYIYQPSKFFTEQLQAFEVWLEHGGSIAKDTPIGSRPASLARKPPDQLPIVLQVLLSQSHRLRALILISKFVDLGPWAVHLTLSIGIFPYVQKLLQSPAADLKPVLIFIWTRILAHDRSCQVDLLKDSGFSYFAKVLAPPTPQTGPLLIPNASEHRAMCAFILSMFCRGFRQGQMACITLDVFRSCFARLQENDWLLKQWCALCIAQMWADGNDGAKMLAIKESYQDMLIFMLKDESAEVRAASMYAIGTFLGATGMPAKDSQDKKNISVGGGTGAQLGMTERQQLKFEAGVAQACVLVAKEDASPLVRKELVVVLSCVAREWRGWFVAAAWAYHEMEGQKTRRELGGESANADDGEDLVAQAMEEWKVRMTRDAESPKWAAEEHQENLTILFIFKLMFSVLLELSVDPHPEVASLACTVTDYILALLVDSAFSRANGSTLRVKTYEDQTRRLGPQLNPIPLASPALQPAGHPVSPESHPPLSRADTGTSATSRVTASLKRNSSIANALKNFASMTGYASAPPEPETPPVQETPSALSRANTQLNLHVQPYIPPYPMARTETGLSTGSARGSDKVSRNSSLTGLASAHGKADFGFTDANGYSPKAVKFSAAQVVHALTEEDMERLRIRRTQRSEAGGSADGKLANGGMPQPHELGLGMVANEVKDDVLPLRSEFYDYCMEYFKDPQMRIPDADEPGSVRFNEQTWRQQRNQRIMEYSRGEDEAASRSPWNRDLGKLPNDAWPSLLTFHAFEPHLAVTDEADNICIWDWQNRQRLSRFATANSNGSCVSSLHFVNETASSLVLTASTDGNVRIYRDYDSADTVQLTSAFHGLAERLPVSRRSGVVSSWEQRTGHLLVAGESKFVRIWDAGIESLVFDIPTQAGSNVTSLASDHLGGNMFIGGFGDGVVRLFDKRMPADRCVVRVLRQHHTWIKSVSMQKGDGRDLVSASMNGDVKIWDIRQSDIPVSSINVFANGLSALAVHDQCPIFATTSAPYASAAHNAVSSAHGSAQRSKGQRLSVYRMDKDDSLASSETTYESSNVPASNSDGQIGGASSTMPNGKYNTLPSRRNPGIYGGQDSVYSLHQGGGDMGGPQPVLLSSTSLKGNIGNAAGPGSAPSPGVSSYGGGVVVSDGADGRSGKVRRRWGAGMNALAFHPNELILAVGGFDHSYGGVRLISYDKGTNKDAGGVTDSVY